MLIVLMKVEFICLKKDNCFIYHYHWLDIPIQLVILFWYSYIVATVINYLFQWKFQHKTNLRLSINLTAASPFDKEF